MESVAHSRHPNKAPVTLSKKITNGTGNAAETLYDHVYGAAPKFAAGHSLSPRFEDYGEIFASFHAPRASAIPLLDLPALDAGEVFFDFRNAACDYSEIFRGFDGLDFWLSYEDLFRHGASEEEEDEEEAWTPVETDSFSEELDHFGNNLGISSGDHLRAFDGSTEFNISYHKVNDTSNEDMSKAKSHISQLPAAPEVTHVFDETTRFHWTDPSLQVVDDVDLDMEFNASQAKRNNPRKAVSHGEQVFGSDLDLHDGCNKNGSHSSEMFVTVSDISLRTLPSHVPPPSRAPPVLDAKQGYTSGFHSNDEKVDSDETVGDTSPPFLDVEVDTNTPAAAIKEVMHRPEAKLRSSKELKERKKGAFESNVNSTYDVNNNDAKRNVNITKFNGLNDEEMKATCDQRIGKKKISATDETQKTTKAAPETLELFEGERLLNVFEEKHIKESRSSQESDRSTGVGLWKEATEFFELVGTEESGKLIPSINHNHTKSLVQDTRTHECGKKEREAFNIQEEYKKVKEIVEGYQLEECKKKSKAGNGAYEQGKNIRKSKSSNEEFRQREHVKNDEMAEIFEPEKSEKAKMARLHGKTEKKVTKADQSGSLKDMSETQRKDLKRVESEKSKEVDRQMLSEVQWKTKHMENEKKLKEDEQKQLSMKRIKQSQKMKENGKIQRDAYALGVGAAQGEQRVKDYVKLEKFERSNEVFNLDNPEVNMTCKRENVIILEHAKQIEDKKGLQEACENEEIEKSFKGSFKLEVNDEGLKPAFEQLENEKGLKQYFELEMNEKRTKMAFERGENEACKRGQGKEEISGTCDGYRKGNRLKDVGSSIGVQEVLKPASELEMNSGNENQRKKEIESPADQTFDREGIVDISCEDDHSKQSERILKDADKNGKDKGLDKALEQMEGNGEGIYMNFAKENNEAWKTESDKNLLAAHSSFIHEENVGKLQVCQEPIADQEIGRTGTDCNVDEKKLEEVWVENLKDDGKKGASIMFRGEAEPSGIQSGKVACTATKADELSFSSEQTCTEKTKSASQMEFDTQSQERKIAREWHERGTTKQHANAAPNPEESRDQISSSQADQSGNYRRNRVADEPSTVQEVVNIQKISQRAHAHVAHSNKSKEKGLDETSASVEKDVERIRRERELEKDRLRKIEEEMERERERQKDRMAVDRAMLEAEREREREKDRMAVDKTTLEARDRAYAEARERAERAAFERETAEARQRVLAEARERLEKACAEARDKTYADKAATEARLKAERTAVERATAEARERAMEKVKVERAAFESRERLARSVSDKFSVSFRSDGRQGSSSSDMLDPHCQNYSSATHSRYPYSSVYGASSFTERSEREGESAQRCRARLERHQRTAERAAKALEEKNMRDRIAQKEQAERNRLAETLDTEVRRWSSGKEGNLRALLSTLQYVDSWA
ncbi:auxilin-like protein 1 isoform X2 [Cajanus cajan]|uniref:auxilin-like protein 1 isoform X2 n=1 Tax=Cajanus cajan TaxID=3821 RepID=UPI0010FB43D4|nr:auxilin-like protein 1 isoform X2 [Cajanus cajan]